MRSWEIGKFKGDSDRYRPTEERVSNYLDLMKNDFKDFDVYLWGSYPNKDTWDVDFLLSNPENLSSKDMENISINSLQSSLIDNNFLADVGFTDKPVVPFNKYFNHYNNTDGNTMQNSGYVYADKWFQNGQVFKDRSKFNEGRMERIGDNMFQMSSSMPYKKMINTINDGTFNNIYGNKPLLIQNRREVYGYE